MMSTMLSLRSGLMNAESSDWFSFQTAKPMMPRLAVTKSDAAYPAGEELQRQVVDDAGKV